MEEDFLNVINEYYPFERYIMKVPKRINYVFDDALLTELFIPATEIKPITDEEGRLITHTRINPEEIFVKMMGPSTGVMRFGFFDFSRTIREDIMTAVIRDMDSYRWESLYMDYGDENEDLRELLEEQRALITKIYGECKVKDTFIIESTLQLL